MNSYNDSIEEGKINRAIVRVNVEELKHLLECADRLVALEKNQGIPHQTDCLIPKWTTIPERLHRPLYLSKMRLEFILRENGHTSRDTIASPRFNPMVRSFPNGSAFRPAMGGQFRVAVATGGSQQSGQQVARGRSNQQSNGTVGVVLGQQAPTASSGEVSTASNQLCATAGLVLGQELVITSEMPTAVAPADSSEQLCEAVGPGPGQERAIASEIPTAVAPAGSSEQLCATGGLVLGQKTAIARDQEPIAAIAAGESDQDNTEGEFNDFDEQLEGDQGQPGDLGDLRPVAQGRAGQGRANNATVMNGRLPQHAYGAHPNMPQPVPQFPFNPYGPPYPFIGNPMMFPGFPMGPWGGPYYNY